MSLTNDAELLKEFVNDRSETAFRTLLERHLGLVFGTARRMTRDAALAEEIAQVVFLLLVQKAARLSRETVLSGWLYRTTRFVAARAIRSEQRRRRREEEAIHMHWQESSHAADSRITADLDEALARLGEQDRQAILLRYLEGHHTAEVAQALGIGEEAAKKRVARALEKLREILARRGVKVSAAALAAALTADAALPSPVGLSERILGRLAAGGAAAGTGLIVDVTRALSWAQIKLAAVLLTVLVGTALWGLWSGKGGGRPEKPAAEGTAEQSMPLRSSVARPGLTVGPLGNSTLKEAVDLQHLRVSVIDAETAAPVSGAEVANSLGLQVNGQIGSEVGRTDSDGLVDLAFRSDLPEQLRELTQFQLFVKADQFAPRDVMFLSSTGSVLKTIPGHYTVGLRRGRTLRGQVVDEFGQPLAGVKVQVTANNYQGYSYSLDESGRVISPPVVRAEDYSSFNQPAQIGSGGSATGRDGFFIVANFPGDLQAALFEFITPDGAHHRLVTPGGTRLTSEKLPPVSMADLRSGRARIVLPRGIDVTGKVVDLSGQPISGAEVAEGRMLGNLQILSRLRTDPAGAFRLPGRLRREVLLAASAPGFASVTTLITVVPGLAPVVLTLPPENPLRGRVQDVDGKPIAKASVQLPDYRNDGLALQWQGETDAEGRFTWAGAPTNEVNLLISAPGYAPLLRPLRATRDEQVITLRDGYLERLRLSGSVVDADSGEPVPFFQVKAHLADRGALPGYLKETVEGRLGAFDLEMNLAEKKLGPEDSLMLVVEAPDFEVLTTRAIPIAEGDQAFELRMHKGGMIEGRVLTPGGDPAVRCQFAFAQADTPVFTSQDGYLPRKTQETTDREGAFHLKAPVNPVALVVFHESGWAIAGLASATARLDVQLKPWAQVEIKPSEDLARQPENRYALDSLSVDPPNAIQIAYDTQTARAPAFRRVPAGEYTVSVAPAQTWIMGQPVLHAFQTNIILAPGELRTVDLGNGGQTVHAQLNLPKDVKQPESFTATLFRDAPAPPEGLEFFATLQSLRESRSRGAADPAILEAKRQQRNFVGNISPDGVVTFAGVQPGRYTLIFKKFDFDNPRAKTSAGPALVAQASFDVEVTPETADLGGFTLENESAGE